jgi:hypothetical protein
MKIRNLPDVVKATFGVGSSPDVKLLTPDTLLHKRHAPWQPISGSISVSDQAHPIPRFALQNYYPKSRIPDPDPCLSGGLGQQ